MSTIETSSLQRSPATEARDAGAIAALAGGVAMTTLVALAIPHQAQAQEKRPNIVMLMTDDTGWSDFGAYGGGTTLGHPDTERRSRGPGGRDLHELVRPSELYGWPRLLHHRPHPDPFGALDRGCPRRRKLSPQGNADDRRILSEERLRHLLLGQVAPRRKPPPPKRRSTASTR